MNDDKDGVNLLTMLMIQWEYQGEIVELHWNIQAIFFLERDLSKLSNYFESRPSSIGLTLLRRTVSVDRHFSIRNFHSIRLFLLSTINFVI